MVTAIDPGVSSFGTQPDKLESMPTMFGISALDLARAQFGFTVAFHILFPAFSIGLAAYLAVLEGLWLKPAGRSISTCSATG